MILAQLGLVVPLDLEIEMEGVGGLTGQAPTVAVRDSQSSTRYLDWSDNVFKTSGWVTQYSLMTEVQRGHYRHSWNTALTPGIVAGQYFVAEYHNPGPSVGDTADLIKIVASVNDVPVDVDLRLSTSHGAGAWDGLPSPTAIANAVWDELVAGHSVAGSFGLILKTNLDVKVSTRALPGDAMSLVVDAVNASTLAASAVSEIAGGTWSAPRIGNISSGSMGEQLAQANKFVKLVFIQTS